MKKLFAIFFLMLLVLSVNARSKRGDVNGDGEVTANDISMIVNHILGYEVNGFIIANADVNGDGEIDIKDVMIAVDIILYGDEESTIPGDVNGDGEVSANDISLFVSYLLEGNEEGFIKGNADVNDDGSLDIKDVMEIVKIILGISGGGDDNPDDDDDTKLPIFDENNGKTNPGSIITNGDEVLGNESSVWDD